MSWYLDQYIEEKRIARKAFIDKSKWELYSEHLNNCAKLLHRQVTEEYWYEDEYLAYLDEFVEYLHVNVVDGIEQDNRISNIYNETRRVWEQELSYYYGEIRDCAEELVLLIEYI